MRKFIFMLRSRVDLSSADFQGWLRYHHLPEVLARAPRLGALVANFVDVPGSRANAGRPAYDAILESWSADDGDPASLLSGEGDAGRWLREDLAGRAERVHGYEVAESVEIVEPAPDAQGIVPGIRNFSLVAFKQGLAPERSRALWDAHVPLAKAGLTGLNGYVRNFGPRPLTPDTPPCQGIGSLNFTTLFESEHYPFLPDIVDFLDLPAIVGMDCTQIVLKPQR